jgi:hypothetical protein
MLCAMPKGCVNRRTVVLFALGAAAASALGLACADNDKSLGADCVKDEDCASGFCSGQVCVAAAPTFDSEPPFGDAGDAGAETEPSDSRPSDASQRDTSSHPEAASDAVGSEPTGAMDVAKGGE